MDIDMKARKARSCGGRRVFAVFVPNKNVFAVFDD